MKKDKKTTIHTRRVPSEVKKKFKAYCAERGWTMTNAIVALMKDTYEQRKELDL